VLRRQGQAIDKVRKHDSAPARGPSRRLGIVAHYNGGTHGLIPACPRGVGDRRRRTEMSPSLSVLYRKRIHFM